MLLFGEIAPRLEKWRLLFDLRKKKYLDLDILMLYLISVAVIVRISDSATNTGCSRDTRVTPVQLLITRNESHYIQELHETSNCGHGVLTELVPCALTKLWLWSFVLLYVRIRLGAIRRKSTKGKIELYYY